MKFIHCADLHLDSKMETNLTQDQARTRRYELLSTFERMVNFALENQIKAIIIAGDMFDTDKNQQKRMKDRVLDIISTAKAVDFLYLQGNHDQDDFFKSLRPLPTNLKLFGDKWTYFTYGNVVVAGLSPTKQGGEFPYSALDLPPDTVNLVTLHGEVVTYENANPAMVSLPLLQNKHIDYLALGHHHAYKMSQLDNRGLVCYSGCLEGRGYDECGEKGFVLLEYEQNLLKTSFVPFAKRTIHEIAVEVTGDHAALSHAIEERVANISSEDFVRVVLIGEISEEIDLEYLVTKFDNQFFSMKWLDRTEIAIDYTQYQNDISLKGEFIRKVLSLSMTKEDTNKIILMGLRALEGREIS